MAKDETFKLPVDLQWYGYYALTVRFLARKKLNWIKATLNIFFTYLRFLPQQGPRKNPNIHLITKNSLSRHKGD